MHRRAISRDFDARMGNPEGRLSGGCGKCPIVDGPRSFLLPGVPAARSSRHSDGRRHCNRLHYFELIVYLNTIALHQVARNLVASLHASVGGPGRVVLAHRRGVCPYQLGRGRFRLQRVNLPGETLRVFCLRISLAMHSIVELDDSEAQVLHLQKFGKLVGQP